MSNFYCSHKRNCLRIPYLRIWWKPFELSFNEGGKWFIFYIRQHPKTLYFSFPSFRIRKVWGFGKKYKDNWPPKYIRNGEGFGI